MRYQNITKKNRFIVRNRVKRNVKPDEILNLSPNDINASGSALRYFKCIDIPKKEVKVPEIISENEIPEPKETVSDETPVFNDEVKTENAPVDETTADAPTKAPVETPVEAPVEDKKEESVEVVDEAQEPNEEGPEREPGSEEPVKEEN